MSSAGTLTTAQLGRDPAAAAGTVGVDGDLLAVRLLTATDARALGVYFDGLSDVVRGVYGPHPLNAAHAAELCAALSYAELLPFVAVDDEAAIAAYFLIQIGLRGEDRTRYVDHGWPLEETGSCTFAPCVADAWQSRGLGSAVMPHVLDVLRRLGLRRVVLWGGVRDDNPRAGHFYHKFGFEPAGHFFAGAVDNTDMVLEL